MKISFDSIKPVYLQIAEAIEDDIIYGKLKEGDASYSQLMIAKELNVNPATAGKGINVLVQKGILEKQRGLSMTVVKGALEMILLERRNQSFNELVEQLVQVAEKIHLSENEVIQLIQNYYMERSNDHDKKGIGKSFSTGTGGIMIMNEKLTFE
jgi:DNA-binding transcriptional regulator YhcF (GntR family)